MKTHDLKDYFDRVFLINLKRRPDRLLHITETLKRCHWPFKWPTVFSAVDGTVVPHPKGWDSGGGAWGCMRSHQQLLERVMMEGGGSVLVLEDDACFIDDFHIRIEEFLREVPDDWDQLMLGGQHVNQNGKPRLVKPGVYRCTDCERTHCYAIRGEFLKALYQRWLNGGEFNGEVHCDWIMGRDPELQLKHKVYAPERFLVGQERGKSDINGGLQPRKFWNPPDRDLPVLHLSAPRQVVASLRDYGIHTGYDRDPESDFDKGLLAAVREAAGQERAITERLSKWINDIQWEVASEPFLICTVWHPEISAELTHKASRWPVYTVVANNISQALNRMPARLRRPKRRVLAKEFVIFLHAPKRVMDALRRQGWHNGYWRDEHSGLDNGLIKLCEMVSDKRKKLQGLAGNIRLLQTEAEAIHGGVATIWHPDVDVGMVNRATSSTVVEIASTNVRGAIDQWDEVKCSFNNHS